MLEFFLKAILIAWLTGGPMLEDAFDEDTASGKKALHETSGDTCRADR